MTDVPVTFVSWAPEVALLSDVTLTRVRFVTPLAEIPFEEVCATLRDWRTTLLALTVMPFEITVVVPAPISVSDLLTATVASLYVPLAMTIVSGVDAAVIALWMVEYVRWHIPCVAINVPNSRITLTIHTNIIFMLDDLRWLLIFVRCQYVKREREANRPRISSGPSEQQKNARRKPLFNGGVSLLFGEKPLWKIRLSPLTMYPDRATISCDTHHLY